MSAVIPSGMNQVCFQFRAVDDIIVEGTEMFRITVYPMNPLDMANGTVTVSIEDNDGEQKIHDVHG